MLKFLVIIGAGISGLSAGCYAQMNGYFTQIFEQHTTPGGVCTSWKLKGHTFDCCIHNLAGSGEITKLHRIWRELGVISARLMIAYDEFVQIEDGANVFTVNTDIDLLETHMKALSPRDTEVIEEFTNATRHFTDFELFSLPLADKWEIVRALKFISSLLKWARISVRDYATRFTGPFLRKVFPLVVYGNVHVPMLFFLNSLAAMHNRDFGWPVGGSLEFSDAIAARYQELGGTLHYNSRVAKIFVENDRAVGVILADGTKHQADIVISNADGRTTIFDMLRGKYTNGRIRTFYAKPVKRQDMTVHVSFGVNRDISN